jgi:putative thioredoxin
MTHSPYVFDATAESFSRLVLENSSKGPCMMLMPRLVRLAGEFGGRFLLVMLNTDEFGALARDHGVVSLPTVKVFRHGRAVDAWRRVGRHVAAIYPKTINRIPR